MSGKQVTEVIMREGYQLKHGLNSGIVNWP